jgi:hypothetical protein
MARSSRNGLRYHHSEFFLSPLLFEDTMERQQQWQAAGVIFIAGEVVLTLHPPLGPLSHDVNPRAGPPEIAGLVSYVLVRFASVQPAVPSGSPAMAATSS